MTELISVGGAGRIDTAIAAWLDEAKRRSGSAKTERAYRDAIAGFRSALQQFGLDLDGDTRALALAAQGWAGQGDVAPATYNQRLAIVSSFYRYAARSELLDIPNPIARVKRATVEAYANVEALSPETIRQQLGAIDRSDEAGLRDYALLAVALNTGRRVAEVAALRGRDVRLSDTGIVTLYWRRAKGGKTARDTLSRPLSAALLAWLHAAYGQELGTLKEDAPIWTSRSRNSKGRALSTVSCEAICRRHLGVHFHALRHTFAHLMERSGARVSEIQARLGHSSLATTGRYLAALKSDENPYAEQLARLMGLDG
jgi:integrase